MTCTLEERAYLEAIYALLKRAPMPSSERDCIKCAYDYARDRIAKESFEREMEAR